MEWNSDEMMVEWAQLSNKQNNYFSFTIDLQWTVNNQWFIITWSRYRLNDNRNRNWTGKALIFHKMTSNS